MGIGNETGTGIGLQSLGSDCVKEMCLGVLGFHTRLLIINKDVWTLPTIDVDKRCLEQRSCVPQS